MRVSQFICWDKETKKSQFQSNLCKKVSLKCEHNFLTNSIHYLNGMSSQVSQLVHDVGQDPAQQLVDNDQHGDYGDETCFGDLPGRQQSCLHPGPAAQAPPAFQFIFCQKERRKALKQVGCLILTSLWMKGILLLTKRFHWRQRFLPCKENICSILLIKNLSDSLRLLATLCDS